jgi:tRNA1Val (adenine37-N6)-methyltransferase
MPNPYFQFKQFTVYHDRSAMKVTTDACLFGAWCATEIKKKNLQKLRCLDIGTGTGLLSLMVAQETDVLIDAIEIDGEAAAQAKENVATSPFSGKIHVLAGDVLQFHTAEKYDVIISNPPFYEEDLRSESDKRNTAHHSARLKLPHLLQKIFSLLKDDGVFYLLLPFKRKAEIEELLRVTRLFVWRETEVKQTEKHLPFRWMIWGGKIEREHVLTQSVIIKKEAAYSEEFVTLLRDYYLYL